LPNKYKPGRAAADDPFAMRLRSVPFFTQRASLCPAARWIGSTPVDLPPMAGRMGASAAWGQALCEVQIRTRLLHAADEGAWSRPDSCARERSTNEGLTGRLARCRPKL